MQINKRHKTAKNLPAVVPPPLDALPGHQIRRLQQIAVAIFLQETSATGFTSVQYAALQAIVNHPTIDQRSLASLVGLDTSTLAGVVERLESRGLIERKPSPEDRRAKQMSPTPLGLRTLAEAIPAMLRAQERILAPLSKSDRKKFMQLLGVLVSANNDFSRAPSSVD